MGKFNIFGNHQLDKITWIISLVRNEENNPDHCFLIMESLDEQEVRIIKKAHLIQKRLSDGSKDLTKAEIIVRDINSQNELNDICCNGICRSWRIDLSQKQKLDEKIEADKVLADENKLNYVKVGNTKTAGSSAASLNFSGLTQSTEEIINKNNSLITNKTIARYRSAHLTHVFTDASWRQGHNCVSWTVDCLLHIYPEENVKTLLANYVAAIPQDVLPSANKKCPCPCIIL